jgi:hypothetical protein
MQLSLTEMSVLWEKMRKTSVELLKNEKNSFEAIESSYQRMFRDSQEVNQ